ncbi:MAG: DUF4129 domain-containing protein [Acaryochloridaceae cyanobacterium RL_2_7]|nr:DUF4129 domain-containing protein [Acaryochloridaceae cyanobacterium RL_2_7]
MLRSIGIPARLATGFGPGQFNPFTGMYVVKNTDAFALTEVYIPKYGWITYDPIPGHPLVPPSVEDLNRFPLLTKIWHWVAGWFPSPVKNLFSQIWMGLGYVLGGLLGLMAQGWSGLGLLLMILSAIAFAIWGIYQGQKYWRYRTWRKQLEPMEQLYQDLLSWLKQKGYEKPKSMTPMECLRDIQANHPNLSDPLLEAVIQAYVQWRYGQKAQNHPFVRKQFQALKKQSRFPMLST